MGASFTIRRAGPDRWDAAAAATLDHFYRRTTGNLPRVTARALYDDARLHVRFDVDDHHVQARCTRYQQMVCRDSCVEFFVEPLPGRGYFNFEINCGGVMLLYFITDPTPTPDGFAGFEPVPPELGLMAEVRTALPAPLDPPLVGPTPWWAELSVPVALFEHYLGPLRPLAGRRWRGNFYKCADASPEPHWASWSRIDGPLSFHKPACFGDLVFV